MQNFIRIGQIVLEYRKFESLNMTIISHLGCQIVKFLVDRQTGNLICITVPNFTKISQVVAEISRLSIFQMAAISHLKFLKVGFIKQLVISGGLIRAIIQNFSKIIQTVFSDGAKQYRNIM